VKRRNRIPKDPVWSRTGEAADFGQPMDKRVDRSIEERSGK
jgi:hypothetical protein